jgi:peptidoglycan-associated lipoprotein
MQTQNFKLKPLRALGIVLTCGALAVGCAGNSVKPLTQETGPVTTAPVSTSPISSDDVKPKEELATASSAPIVTEATTAPADAAAVVAENTPKSEEISAVTQPTQMTFYFGLNKTDLNDQDKAIIKEHARFLKANPGLVLEINGHTDHKGPHGYNEFLSKLRAESVAKLLIADGITRSQLVINALADDKPLADTTNPGKNRRVELQYDEMNMVSTN